MPQVRGLRPVLAECVAGDEVTLEVEGVANRSMDGEEALG